MGSDLLERPSAAGFTFPRANYSSSSNNNNNNNNNIHAPNRIIRES
jgi:hypothetical protein